MSVRLKEERVESLSLAIAKALADSGVQIVDRGSAVRRIAARIGASLGGDSGALDRAVRSRIASLQRTVPEGGREWEVLYRKYTEELSRRR
ncbi:MAG TPA: DUF507 family protein [Candidatus Limnocylindrales bacterium]|nr:DUF507 family protein [Candidatus Limnocylindrales bacterium]